MKTLLASLAVLLAATFTAWADPSGVYAVQGKTPKGEEYAGELEIAKVGDVFELTYTYADGSEQSGSAIGDDSFLAYGYGDDDEIGVGLMTSEGSNWSGVWTFVGADKMGLETWKRQ